jgi:hypothetical protein
MDTVMVLIHSPLVGPLTWSPVAGELRRRGVPVVVPTLRAPDRDLPPFWERHVEDVVRDVADVPAGTPLVLVGHSGAGLLLPAVRQRVGHPVAAYIFVDASIPADGKNVLDLIAAEDSVLAGQLRELLSSGGTFPSWREEDLRTIVPDPGLRRQLIDELQPRPLAFFAEPIRVFAGWPDAPCGYLKFSGAYDAPAARARRENWVYREIAGEHFHMLVDAPAVTDTLLELVTKLLGHPEPRPPATPAA